MIAGIANPVFFIGIVEDRIDPRLEGRVKVRAFGFHGLNHEISTSDLPWAKLILGHHSTNFLPPPLNSWVFGIFLDGHDAQQPLIFGIIPTQMTDIVDPVGRGYGAISEENHSLNSMGHRPEDYGQPPVPAAARGEPYVNDPHTAMETTRVTDIKIAGSDETWSEPGSAYDPQYPFNHVYDTASGHSIQIDDTPGAERVFVFHRAGSYVQMDSTGSVAVKAASDLTQIAEGNLSMFAGNGSGGAKCTVTIMGDCNLYVDGNKTEEVRGDLKQIVHGNYILDCAGQANINSADQTQVRGAKLVLESNVEHLSLKAGKEVRLTSGDFIQIKSNQINIEAGAGTSLKTDTLIMESGGNSSWKSGTLNIQTTGNGSLKAGTLKLEGGKTSLRGGSVHVDSRIHLAEGSADYADGVEGSAEAAVEAIVADLPEPAPRSVPSSDLTGGGSAGSSSLGVAGGSSYSGGSYSARDDGSDGGYGGDFSDSSNPISSKVNVRQLYDWMIEAGLDHNKAIGALVNVKRESAFDHTAHGDTNLGRGSFGLFQFYTGAGRGDAMLVAVPDWKTNPKGQIMFAFHKDPDGIRYRKKAPFPTDIAAANWFTEFFEIPQKRYSYIAPGGYNDQNIQSVRDAVGRGGPLNSNVTGPSLNKRSGV